jgi:hypothetical protein
MTARELIDALLRLPTIDVKLVAPIGRGGLSEYVESMALKPRSDVELNFAISESDTWSSSSDDGQSEEPPRRTIS